MTIPELLDFKFVAGKMGVAADSLRKVADKHELTILIGRKAKLHPDDIPELLNKCRVKQKGPASIGTPEKTPPRSGKSGTAPSVSRPARQTAKKLKSISKTTSHGKDAQVVQFSRTK